MRLEHRYEIDLEWLGNRGSGTSEYKAYGREHLVSSGGKPPIAGSADRVFHGDAARWNPEELLVAALSQCHMLSYLHVAMSHGLIVTAYTDSAIGVMEQAEDGAGRFRSVTLRPRVTITDPTRAVLAQQLHAEAARKCFIANSVNFPVGHEPQVLAP